MVSVSVDSATSSASATQQHQQQQQQQQQQQHQHQHQHQHQQQQQQHSPPAKSVVHGSLVTVQCIFGAGGVIAALGLPSCNPFAFALYREISAGSILIIAAIMASKRNRLQDEDANGKERLLSSSSSSSPSSSSPSSSPSKGPSSMGHLIAKSEKQEHGTSEIKIPARRAFYPRKNYAWLPWHFVDDIGPALRLITLGLMIFGNQAFVIVGIKLAGPVSCAVWQPSQPIITTAICMLLRREPFRLQRLMGVLLAFAGCAAMVVLSTKQAATATATIKQLQINTENNGKSMSVSSDSTDAAATIADASSPYPGEGMGLRNICGNVCFFCNCFCTSLYVILSKPALRVYPALFVTAWSYNIASAIMAVTTLLAAQSPKIMNLVCPDCLSNWEIPSGAYFALVYYIIFNSVVAYAILTWVNQFATGTLVMGYSVLQPVTAATLTVVLLVLQAFPSCFSQSSTSQGGETSSSSSSLPKACLEQPGMGTLLGMCGVFVGLFFVIITEPQVNNNTVNSRRKKEETHKEEGGVALSSMQKRLLKRPLSIKQAVQVDMEPLNKI